MYRILLVLLLISSAAYADDCTKLTNNLKTMVNKYDHIINKANNLFLDCLFTGTNDGKVKKLADELNKLQDHASTINMNDLDLCMEITTNATDFFQTIGDRSGEIFGKAVLACTVKGQEIIKSDMDDSEKIDKITALINSYMELK